MSPDDNRRGRSDPFYAPLQRAFGLFGSNARMFFSAVANKPSRRISTFPAFITADKLIAYGILILVTFLLIDPLTRTLSQLTPDSAKISFRSITVFGASHWYLVPAGVPVLLAAFVDWRRVSRRVRTGVQTILWQAAALFAAVVISGIAVNLLKRAIGRARPKLMEDVGVYGFDPFAFTSSFASFPSGHSTTIGAVAVFAAVIFPRWIWTIIAIALIVGWSRVVVGAHYPSDIVAGLAFGALFAWGTLSFFAARRLGFKRGVARSGPHTFVAPRRTNLPLAAFVHDTLVVLTTSWTKELPKGSNGAKKRGKYADATAETSGAQQTGQL
ncbi:MAG: phosphatase PAP2 family protein [Pseudomonadota bacterium]